MKISKDDYLDNGKLSQPLPLNYQIRRTGSVIRHHWSGISYSDRAKKEAEIESNIVELFNF